MLLACPVTCWADSSVADCWLVSWMCRGALPFGWPAAM